MSDTQTPAEGHDQVDQRHGGGPGVLVSFGPWIAVWILTSNNSYIPGLIVAVVVEVLLIAWTYWEGKKPKLLDWGTLVVLSAITVIGLIVNEAWLGNWLNPMLNGGLLLVMVASVVVGKPFTIEYAKEQTPPEIWETKAFRSVNMTITVVWILCVLAMLIGSLIDSAYSTGLIVSDAKTTKSVETWANWGVTIIALVVAMKFGAWYPDAYKERQQRLGRPLS